MQITNGYYFYIKYRRRNYKTVSLIEKIDKKIDKKFAFSS